MSSCNLGQLGRVCSELLRQIFGDIVCKVGSFLLQGGGRSIFDILTTTGLPLDEVKKALIILIQHNLVKFVQNARNPNIPEYSLILQHVLCLLRFPKYLYHIKTSYGDEAEILLEELLVQGQDSASNLIFQATKRLNEAMDDSNQRVSPLLLSEKLQNLILNNFIIQCPSLIEDGEKKVPTFDDKEHKAIMPTLDIKSISNKIKENAQDLGPHSDSSILWRVNYSRFDEEMRKIILITAAARRVDSSAGELLHLLLELWSQNSNAQSPVSNPVSVTQIKDAIKKKSLREPLPQYCDQYLKILSEDSSRLIVKAGDAGGGQYVVNYADVFKTLACSILDSVVLERFGSKAARLFRLTRLKQYLEQDQMQQLSMIPAKEAKLYAYRLLEHNFLQLRELKKSISNSVPVKTFFLFHVDLQQVVRTALDMCYKGLYNVLVRREQELKENKRLLDKQARVESILVSLKEQGAADEQLSEVEEMITPPERTLLTKIQYMVDQLSLGEMQVDESIFILETFLQYTVLK